MNPWLINLHTFVTLIPLDTFQICHEIVGYNRNIILIVPIHTKQGHGFCAKQKQMATTLLSVHRFLPSQSKQIWM